jgi:hypothetical protein
VPFPADGLIAKLRARTTNDPPAPSALDADLPRGFDDVLGRALAKDPDRRFASAGALADAARRALRTAPRGRARWAPSRRAGPLVLLGTIAVALLAVLLLTLTGGHGPARAGAAGRTLPAPASLHPCGDLLTAPAGYCRNGTGGVDVLTLQGATARMHTMDFKVLQVTQSRVILDPDSHDTATAPSGERFVILECAITNRTRTAQVFEPGEFSARQAELFLYTAAGERLRARGPSFAEYSAQNLPAAGLVPLSLVGEEFERPEPVGLPSAGVLVFSYPVADLRSAHSMLLFVHEFGQSPAAARSVGVFRLALDHSVMRTVYKAAGI